MVGGWREGRHSPRGRGHRNHQWRAESGRGQYRAQRERVDPPSKPPPPHQRSSSKTHAFTRGNTAYSTVTLTFTLRSEAEKQDNVDVCEVEAIALAAGVPDVSYNAPLFGIVSYRLWESRNDSAIFYEHDIAFHISPRRRMQLCPEMICFVREPPFCVFTKQCLSQARFGQFRLNLAWFLNDTQGNTRVNFVIFNFLSFQHRNHSHLRSNYCQNFKKIPKHSVFFRHIENNHWKNWMVCLEMSLGIMKQYGIFQ